MKITGRNAVYEALKSDATIDKVLVENGLRDGESKKLLSVLKENSIKVTFADRQILEKECGTRSHQGFVAYTSEYKYYELEDIVSGEGDLFLVLLDGIEDPHNLGSILRVCECAAVDGVVITKHRSACVNETVMRTSMGAANNCKVARVTNLNSAIDFLKSKNVWVTAIELGGENIYKADFSGRIALVIGGEDTGVNKLTQKKCDRVASIPMKGKINSLNASVACGVAVFEALRKRTLK